MFLDPYTCQLFASAASLLGRVLHKSVMVLLDIKKSETGLMENWCVFFPRDVARLQVKLRKTQIRD